MAIYEYECPDHGRFEILQRDFSVTHPCPLCEQSSPKILSRIGQVKVIHTEQLPFNSWQRIENRQKILKDTSIMKALADYKEERMSGYKLVEVQNG